MGMSHGTHARHTRFAMLVAVFWLHLALAFALYPTRALAATNYGITMVRNGVVAGAPRSECTIVANLSNPQFSTSNSSEFKLWPAKTFYYISEKGGAADQTLNVPTITYDYTPPADKGTRSTNAWVQLDYPNGLLDNKGRYHNLHIRFDHISVTYRANATAAGLSKVRQIIFGLYSDAPTTYAFHCMLYNPSNNRTLGYSYSGDAMARTVATEMKVSVWYDDDGSTPRLLYNLYGWDVDMPDRVNYNNGTTAAAWNSNYAEHFSFTKDDGIAPVDTVFGETSGANGVIHVESSTKIQVLGGRVVGSSEDDATYASGFSTSLAMGTSYQQTGMKFWWGGSRCSSALLRRFTYSLTTRAGEGGHAWISAGGGGELDEDRPDIATQQNIINLAETSASEAGYITQRQVGTIPKNDYTALIIPDEGYRVKYVSLDGTEIDESGSGAGTSDFGSASVSYDDDGWAHVSVSSVSRDHIIRALFEPLPEPSGGTLELVKSSALPLVTDDNAAYSLEGASYGVFSDEECEQLVATLETDSSGATRRIELAEGTYYVRELSASQGFYVDESVYEVEVALGETTELKVAEDPAVSNLELSIEKHDAETESTQTQGTALLSGALFDVNYYDGHYESLSELPEAPTCRWTISTDAEGHATLATESIVSGDEPYEYEASCLIPLGTVVVREAQAPEGYLLPDDTLVSLTCIDLVDGQVAHTAHAGQAIDAMVIEDPVIRGGLKLRKADQEGAGLSDAVFSVINTSPKEVVVGGKSYGTGEVCLQIVSTDGGIAESESNVLPYGSYEVHETKAPEGFSLNGTWKGAFSIEEQGQVVDLTPDPVIDTPLSASIQLSAAKDFDGSSQGRELEQGMFTFTLADEEGEAIDTKSNDADGKVVFDELSFGYEDLGRRITYRIYELEGNDEQIVYDTHVETVYVSVEQDSEGALACRLETDEDGVVFKNHTVKNVELPLTGQEGVGGGIASAITALVVGVRLRRRRMQGWR